MVLLSSKHVMDACGELMTIYVTQKAHNDNGDRQKGGAHEATLEATSIDANGNVPDEAPANEQAYPVPTDVLAIVVGCLCGTGGHPQEPKVCGCAEHLYIYASIYICI